MHFFLFLAPFFAGRTNLSFVFVFVVIAVVLYFLCILSFERRLHTCTHEFLTLSHIDASINE